MNNLYWRVIDIDSMILKPIFYYKSFEMKVISRLEHRQKMLIQVKSSNPALKIIVLKDLIADLE